MSEVKVEDVVALQIEEELLCSNCIEREEVDWRELSVDQLVQQQDLDQQEEALYFCDRCGKHI
jgi:hypothetical protein